MNISNYIKEMRPKQWIKNSFVFPALIFSKSFTDVSKISLVFMGFILFCLASSSVYIVNDIIDRKKDALHPTKSKRPIAAGRIKVYKAYIFAVVMIIVAVVGAYMLSFSFMLTLLAYMITSTSYSLWLKNQPIIDIMTIAVGFVLRTLAGALVIGVDASPWLLLCTSVLCLFLAANKRASELAIMKDMAGDYKATLSIYTEEFLDKVITICSSLCIVLYALYCYFTHLPIMITTIFVIYTLLRYHMVAKAEQTRDNVELILFYDKPLLIGILLWGVSCLLIVIRFY